MELKETNHSYYFSESNYYVGGQNGENYGRSDYDTWEDFMEEWRTHDKDMNFLVRYDIYQKEDEEENKIDEYRMEILYILQRKGIYRPVHINNITKNDMNEITEFLKSYWEHMKTYWVEIMEG